MNDNMVVAVLLADGWHQIVPGSFSVGPLSLETGTNLDVSGFRFEEADAGRPYQPAVLAGPLNSIIAVRQVTPAVRHIGDPDRARAAHNGHRADRAVRVLAGAGR